jgi:DNA-binding Xre family transcriptional regulator
MLRFRLADILRQKGWTPYRLSQLTGLSAPTTYRLADPSQQFGRFTADTLDRLCEALDVQPGELLEWVPDPKTVKRVKAAHPPKKRGRAA